MIEEKASSSTTGTGQAAKSVGDGKAKESARLESGAFAASRVSSGAKPGEVSDAHGINQELRRLNRALRAMTDCNQALAHARSEQELVQQFCEIIVRVAGYRMAFIAYAEHDAEKTVRPMAAAGHEEGYLQMIALRWSDT